MNSQRGSVSLVFAILFGLLFLLSAGFGSWAFMERQSYKNDVDTKIEKAVIIAVQEAETAQENEFLEQEKLPTRVYSGPVTYGSLQFNYPKTWSIYVEEKSSGTVLDLYASPLVVPGISDDQSYALHVEIESKSYDSEVSSRTKDVEKGIMTAAAFRPDKVPGVLGVRYDGEIEKDKQGAAVYLPLRDKTIKISTQAQQFINDFNTIVVPSISFIP